MRHSLRASVATVLLAHVASHLAGQAAVSATIFVNAGQVLPRGSQNEAS